MTTLPEQLLLAGLDPSSGRLHSWGLIDYGLGGAQLVELVLLGKLALRGRKLRVADPGRTGDRDLDRALARIARPDRLRGPQYWVGKLAKGARRSYLRRLAEAGVVRPQKARVAGLIPVTRHVLVGDAPRSGVLDDLRRAVLQDEEPPASTAALLAIVFAVNLGPRVFSRAERREHRAHIKRLTSKKYFSGPPPAEDAAGQEALAAVVNATVDLCLAVQSAA